MKFNVNQQDLQKSLNYCQGVIEKRSTLPILSNVLLEVAESKLKITATDLDLIFINQISNVEIQEEGKTTTSSSIMYDIVRKFSSGKKINFSDLGENKLHLESEKSVFNLNCMSPSDFPLSDENFSDNDWQSAFDQNLMSAIRMIRGVIPTMRQRGGGSIITITSSSVKEPIDILILSFLVFSKVAIDSCTFSNNESVFILFS